MRNAGFVSILLLSFSATVVAQPLPPPRAPKETKAQPAPKATPASRSAAALAASPHPTFDDETYQRISEALLAYSALQVRGGWPSLPADAKLAPGVTGPTVVLLRRRLVITEDVGPDKESGETYDADVVEGVKRFQLRHGLETTGSVGPRTLEAINVPIARRIRQLSASLARLVGMDFQFAQRYVVVNLTDTHAEAINGDSVERRYVVVVGSTRHPSPTLTTSITSVNINPTWTVPLSITKNEIIPHMQKNPNYLSRMRMRVLDANNREIDPRSIDWHSGRAPNFYVRQDHGSGNALGFLKIDMPNPYSVYMHDTNLKNFFDANYRFLSHGCSRVDNVRDLGAWLLQDNPGWGRKQIDAAIDSGKRIDVRLTTKIPVAWIYLTGWMTRDGTVQFRNDIYGRDERPTGEMSDEQAALLSAARAGGFVQQASSPARPAQPRPAVTQASNLDSR
jgi:murein L,D-transpeptidase YcbB/YkuD